MNCLFCDKPTEQAASVVYNCYNCPIKVGFNVINSPGEVLLLAIYFWVSFEEKTYFIVSRKNETTIRRDFSDIITLNYGVDLTPQTAPGFARKLLNLKAFA